MCLANDSLGRITAAEDLERRWSHLSSTRFSIFKMDIKTKVQQLGEAVFSGAMHRGSA